MKESVVVFFVISWRNHRIVLISLQWLLVYDLYLFSIEITRMMKEAISHYLKGGYTVLAISVFFLYLVLCIDLLEVNSILSNSHSIHFQISIFSISIRYFRCNWRRVSIYWTSFSICDSLFTYVLSSKSKSMWWDYDASEFCILYDFLFELGFINTTSSMHWYLWRIQISKKDVLFHWSCKLLQESIVMNS